MVYLLDLVHNVNDITNPAEKKRMLTIALYQKNLMINYTAFHMYTVKEIYTYLNLHYCNFYMFINKDTMIIIILYNIFYIF